MNAPIKKVPIYINDTLLHELSANKIFSKTIAKEGRYRIAVDGKGESTTLLTVKFGNTYYFKCEVRNGLWFGKPAFHEVEDDIGSTECEILEIKTNHNK